MATNHAGGGSSPSEGATFQEKLVEKFYRSKSGKYTGTIVGQGKTKQCNLDEASQRKLAADNLKLIKEQNRGHM